MLWFRASDLPNTISNLLLLVSNNYLYEWILSNQQKLKLCFLQDVLGVVPLATKKISSSNIFWYHYWGENTQSYLYLGVWKGLHLIFDGEQISNMYWLLYHSFGNSMIEESTINSIILECRKHLLLFWLEGLHLPIFFDIPFFPNPVPHMDEMEGHLPKFKDENDDNPIDHLLEFHECMHQLNIVHEDVLMKMFIYSLEEDACEWSMSLHPSSIA